MTDKTIENSRVVGSDWFKLKYSRKSENNLQYYLDQFDVNDYYIYKSSNKFRQVKVKEFYDFKYAGYIFFKKDPKNKTNIMTDKTMKTIRIKNENKQLTDHFFMLEYYSPRFPKNVEFDMPECFLESSEILREYFDCPVIITSTVRPNDSFGYHRSGRAVDYITTQSNSIILFKIECMKYQNLEGSELISNLRKAGINSFGIENSCIHLDVRNSNTVSTDEYGKYIVWSWKPEGGPNGTSIVYNRKKI